MSVNRRRQRSVRITVALVLLAVATVVVAVAFLAGGAVWLGFAALVAWGTGIAASRIISNELAASRRDHARDRAEQAQAYNDLQEQRVAEQSRFAATMKQKVEDHARTIKRLKATLRLAEKRAEFAEQTADRNKVAVAKAHQQIASLKTRIAGLEAELAQATAKEAAEAAKVADVAGTPGAGDESEESVYDLESLQGVDDAPTVVDLLAWEGQAKASAESRLDRRKQA